MIAPIKNTPIRIFQKNNNILIYEDYIITDQDGLTKWIPLYIDESAKSIKYEVEINSKNKLVIPVILYPNEYTHLQIELDISTSQNKISLPDRYDHCFHNYVIPFISSSMHLHSFYLYMQDAFYNHIKPSNDKSTIPTIISSFFPLLNNYLTYPHSYIHIFYESSLIYFTKTFQSITKYKFKSLSKTDIQYIQQQLNIISISYPSLPCILNENGIWDMDSEQVLISFSNIFALPKSKLLTPLHIQRIYEIAYATYVYNYNRIPLPTPLHIHSFGIHVKQLQKDLNELHKFYPEIPLCDLNMHYDDKTKNSVQAYQHMLGIKEDGIVSKTIWILIQQTIKELNSQ